MFRLLWVMCLLFVRFIWLLSGIVILFCSIRLERVVLFVICFGRLFGLAIFIMFVVWLLYFVGKLFLYKCIDFSKFLFILLKMLKKWLML